MPNSSVSTMPRPVLFPEAVHDRAVSGLFVRPAGEAGRLVGGVREWMERCGCARRNHLRLGEVSPDVAVRFTGFLNSTITLEMGIWA